MTNARTVRKYAIVVAANAVICLMIVGLAEFAYRVRLKGQIENGAPSYRVTPAMYVEFDAAHGERFKPNHDLWISCVEDGRLVWGTTASRSNADGLGGRTTLAEYDSSDVKILVFGDSFTHWNQKGETWPDLLQAVLSRRLGKRVAVLNYARGAYGVIQMLELAADRAPALRPDLVVLAPIGDDFSRARWWCQEVQKDGVTRWMMSSKKDEFLDYRFAVDEVLIDPRTTPGWCDSTWHRGGYDPVVASLNERYAAISRGIWAVHPPVELFTLRHSYLLAWLVLRDPLAGRHRTLPRVPFTDYGDDEGALAAIERLKSSRVPVLLVYLPVEAEVDAGRAMMTRQALKLKLSLEREMGVRFEELYADFVGRRPEPFDLRPFDRHPSRAALEFYAENVAERCMRSAFAARTDTTLAGR